MGSFWEHDDGHPTQGLVMSLFCFGILFGVFGTALVAGFLFFVMWKCPDTEKEKDPESNQKDEKARRKSSSGVKDGSKKARKKGSSNKKKQQSAVTPLPLENESAIYIPAEHEVAVPVAPKHKKVDRMEPQISGDTNLASTSLFKEAS